MKNLLLESGKSRIAQTFKNANKAEVITLKYKPSFALSKRTKSMVLSKTWNFNLTT